LVRGLGPQVRIDRVRVGAGERIDAIGVPEAGQIAHIRGGKVGVEGTGGSGIGRGGGAVTEARGEPAERGPHQRPAFGSDGPGHAKTRAERPRVGAAGEAEVLLVGPQAQGGGEVAGAERVLYPEAGGAGGGADISVLPGLPYIGACQPHDLAGHEDPPRRRQTRGMILAPLLGAAFQLMRRVPGVEEVARVRAGGTRTAVAGRSEPASVRSAGRVEPRVAAGLRGFVPPPAVDAFRRGSQVEVARKNVRVLELPDVLAAVARPGRLRRPSRRGRPASPGNLPSWPPPLAR